MKQPLRSLSGLIDFECAARWNSFKLAAVELHKTPAAVSQQIKQLEQSLGFPLFVRHARHITITEKGRELASTLSWLLKELHAKVDALQEGDEESVLRISATHSFTMKWLVPRLHRFTELHPAFDIRVEASDQLAELRAGACDIAIRYGRIADGDDAAFLYREQWVVVFSPELIPTSQREKSGPPLQELARQPLLYEGTPEGWMRLLEANGIRSRRFHFSRGYSHSGVLVQAAVAAHGVALAPYSLAYEDILHGRLRCCQCKPLVSHYGYRLRCTPGKEGMPKVERFTAWMRAEMAEMARKFRDSFSRPAA